jgi:hypothetical protein
MGRMRMGRLGRKKMTKKKMTKTPPPTRRGLTDSLKRVRRSAS